MSHQDSNPAQLAGELERKRSWVWSLEGKGNFAASSQMISFTLKTSGMYLQHHWLADERTP